MALSFDQLQDLMKGEGLHYFMAPDRPAVRFSVAGVFGKFDLVIHLQEDGRFLQFRTLNYAECPAAHPHLFQVLKLLGLVNYQKRLLKLGWDPASGDIIAYADLWVMDGQVTQEQFHRMLHNFVPGIDTSQVRIRATLETGNDPGEPDPTAILQRLGAPPAPDKPAPEIREI